MNMTFAEQKFCLVTVKLFLLRLRVLAACGSPESESLVGLADDVV